MSDPANPGHEEHLLSYRTIVSVWVGLVVLTLVTVGASQTDLKHMAIFAAILIACAKSTLVVMYFMHLRFEKRVFTWFFVTAIGTYAIFLILTFADYFYRR